MAIIRGTYVTKLAGKVGNVVYRNRGGQNIASEKSATVKNPRSDAQQRQRMVFATVSAAYSAMKEICDHSFEGVTYGADNMAEFMRRNLSVMKSRTKNFNGKGNPYIMPNPYLVSRGSLPTIAVSDVTYGINYNNAISLVLADSGITSENIATYTIKKFHDALGLEVGDQLTFIGIAIANNGERISWPNARFQPQYQFVYARLIFDPSKASELLFPSNELNTAALTADSLNVSAIDADVASASSNVNWTIRSGNFANTSDNTEIVAATVIASRKTGMDWMRSTQLLSMSDDTDSEWTDEGMLPTYSPTGEKYLNNAAV